MPDWVSTLLDLASQVTGGRHLEQPRIITHFVIGAFGWLFLLIAASSKIRESRSPRERLLIWAFSLGLIREVLMILVKVLSELGFVNFDRFHVFFPPAEHLLQSVAFIVAAAAFILYSTQDDRRAKVFLVSGIVAMVACYLATFWWWGTFIQRFPLQSFGDVWCDQVFHSVLSLWLIYAVVFLWHSCQGWLRYSLCTAFTLFLLTVFLKIPDNLTGEIYQSVYGPIRHGSYLVAIPLLGYVYIREQKRELEDHREALRINEERLSMAFQVTNDALWDHDFLSQELFLNDIFLANFGEITPRSVGSDTWYSKVHPDDRLEVSSSFEKALMNLEHWEGHYRFLRLDGSYATVIDRCHLTRDASGSVIRALGAMADVTELKALEKSVLEISEEEQRRIGRDLHDDLCQRLFGLDCQVQSLQHHVEITSANGASKTVRDILTSIGEANACARELALGLSPMVVHTDDLEDVFVQIGHRAESVYSLKCRLDIELDNASNTAYDPDTGTQLLRVSQEAIRNAFHHGKATEIDLKLHEMPGQLILEIIDNGIGCDDFGKSGGLGMRTMRYRIEHLNGGFSIESSPGEGTHIKCRVPFLNTNPNSNE